MSRALDALGLGGQLVDVVRAHPFHRVPRVDFAALSVALFVVLSFRRRSSHGA
jgi:hypothetical protein